jgi:hypothetical protein
MTRGAHTLGCVFERDITLGDEKSLKEDPRKYAAPPKRNCGWDDLS